MVKEFIPPSFWRSLKVVPLYKGKGDSTDCNNYRAIAIMPPLAKLLMALINRRLELYAETNNLHTDT